MTRNCLFGAVAALGLLAAPAAAQSYQQPYQGYPQAYPQTYPQAYPQTYPGYGQPGYAQPGYGYPGQSTGVVGQIIDQLLGNRYNVTDRRAVSQCASAALAQAQVQYRSYGQGYPGQGYSGQGYAQPYGGQGYYPSQNYNQGYSQAMRVTAITDVQRRSGSLRVRGLIATGMGYNQSYGGAGYAMPADLSFRCNVDYRGAVTNVRLTRNNTATPYRRY